MRAHRYLPRPETATGIDIRNYKDQEIVATIISATADATGMAVYHNTTITLKSAIYLASVTSLIVL